MKRIQQTIWKSIVVIAGFTFVVSCSDKLDTQEGQLNTGDLDYTDTEEMIQPVIGAYYEFYTRGWEDPLLLSVRGDDVNAGGLGDQQPFADTDMFTYSKDYWMYNSLWNQQYSDIITVNTAINQILQFREFADEEGQAEADQYIAEMKVLRAWFHLNLARTWEDVFIITSNQPEEEIENGVSSKEEIMNWISDQMDEAIPDLPDMRPNQRTDIPGGVTMYTAYAIKAQAQQELQNYQGVADAAGAIINSGMFSLYPDFYELFKKPGELSDESLLELQFSDYGQETGDAFYHLYDPFGPQGWTPARENASSGWGFFEPSFKWIEFMLDRDETVRLETSVLFTDRGIAELEADGYTNLPSFVSNTTRDGDVINDFARAYFSSGKHYLPSNQLTDMRNNYGAGKNYIVIRYAEVLLMYAEALTQGASGNAISADEAVNQVRSRAGLSALTGVTTEQVLDEKFAELAMEWGIRYYDMIRLDKYDELSYDGRSFSAGDEYLPYPQAQVDALPLNATSVNTDTAINDALNNLN
ncbi:MAG: RagB/SusD family nutrient uptake outer membrane protein [Bacteroidota bacterium]|nr:RagB/SusD family nutrient uptake outer membrane protein [Christiangramia sp.]MEE2771807.1 RagB/SusD family nutrient uptake outer membrane protein [Bacteroidota bacterium]|tara:strand:- start:19 stop:1599 length:1581 start_codon:yes stop_codon:yes gene_type:complete